MSRFYFSINYDFLEIFIISLQLIFLSLVKKNSEALA